jgi:muconolactone D-isomerase
MLFHVSMDVSLPYDLDPATRKRLLSDEKSRAQDLQEQGIWLHLWRVVGRYSNISVFDVTSSDELHEILWSLPLFPFMDVEVKALARHPSALDYFPGG